jgi:hypothetical protein
MILAAALILSGALIFGGGLLIGAAIHRVNPSDEIVQHQRSRIPVCIPRGSLHDEVA